MKKMTKRDYFKTLLTIEGVKDNKALVDFVNHELELLEKKNSADRKPTASQVANETFKTVILTGLEDGKKYTVSEMIKAFPGISDLTNQRVSALVRQLVADNKVVRVEEKRKAYFSLA